MCLGLIFGGCKKRAETPDAAQVSMMASAIKFEYAVYLLPGNARNPEAAYRKAVAKNFPKLKTVEEVTKNSTQGVVSGHFQKDVSKRYAPPNLETLRSAGHGLTPEQERELQSTRVAFIMQFGHPSEQVWTALRNADLLVEEVARESSGLVWDEETREVFTPDAWHERRLASWPGGIPDMSTQFTIDTYQNGDFVRGVTLGMGKAGLPDVVVEDFGWSSTSQMGSLINAFCQIMAEGQLFAVPGKAEINLQMIRNDVARTRLLKSFYENAAGVSHLYLKNGQRRSKAHV